MFFTIIAAPCTVRRVQVGKSSLMNALVGRKVTSVSRTPGHTKHFQTYFIDVMPTLIPSLPELAREPPPSVLAILRRGGVAAAAFSQRADRSQTPAKASAPPGILLVDSPGLVFPLACRDANQGTVCCHGLVLPLLNAPLYPT